MMNAFTVRQITAAETRPVRHIVLWPHKENVEECVIDVDAAPHAHHVGAFDESGVLVGVCSMFHQRSERFPGAISSDQRVYRLRVMGTLNEVRGQGAGAAIIDYACQWCKSKGVNWIWCDAREIAFPFYEKQGFSFLSELYEVHPVGPHRMMARKL